MINNIDWISNQLDEFPNNRNKPGINRKQGEIQEEFFSSIKCFLESEANHTLFELPDVSNTTGILEYTRWFFKSLFEIAKNHNNFGKRICVVIEEAHTVIPEWNFIGERDKHAGSLVNCISQIALQGRKYDIGFVIIAQRTANVSKTVLTQCNSIIAFQQFDKTSTDFLSNYTGSEMAKALPNLWTISSYCSWKRLSNRYSFNFPSTDD
ncbi:MAG: ATP-binding protein [Planctomycetes bacterium]|nr:ATP-binding protein [Planctomycetota bacterium]